MSAIEFYNPSDIGTTILGVTQINKLMPFTSVNGVFISNPLIKIYNCNQLIKEYSLTDGLVLTGDNTNGVSKTLTLTLNGTDFISYKDRKIVAKCSFFGVGDIEIIFKISVK